MNQNGFCGRILWKRLWSRGLQVKKLDAPSGAQWLLGRCNHSFDPAEAVSERVWRRAGVLVDVTQVSVNHGVKESEYSANGLESLAEWRSTPRLGESAVTRPSPALPPPMAGRPPSGV